MNMSVDRLGMYNSSTASKAVTDTKAEKLSSTLSHLDKSSDEELMSACKEFEAYFLEQVFKSMEKTVMKNEDSSDFGYMNYFGDMLPRKYAENATEQGGYGIAQMLYESMKR